MYYDTKSCTFCGSAVDLVAHDDVQPRDGKDPDGTVDVRVCTNSACETNSTAAGAQPLP